MDLNIDYYVVDTTILRVGKDKSKDKSKITYSGYKNYPRVKFQVICDINQKIKSISKSYDSSIHDKKVFLSEYEELKKKINKTLSILGDKAYVGLEKEQVITSSKRNEKRYKIDKLK